MLRGTKRVCFACEVRFYDLVRDPIICPACGAEHTPGAPVTAASERAPYPGKSSWRTAGFKRPAPPVKVNSELDATEEEMTQETPADGVDDNIVLEQEVDDGDVSDFVDCDVEERKDR
jgi:uncharacterized protein (TIGR02300 family)